jgi:tRNA nucleotidyltransferase/poly(A) polymerase
LITPDDASQILRWLKTASIEVWLDGGWDVDALLGDHTRPHNDLDIVIRESEAPRVRGVLECQGFREKAGGTVWNFVLVDDRSREVDVHTVRFDHDGNGSMGRTGSSTRPDRLMVSGRQRHKWRTASGTNGALAITTMSACYTSGCKSQFRSVTTCRRMSHGNRR